MNPLLPINGALRYTLTPPFVSMPIWASLGDIIITVTILMRLAGFKRFKKWLWKKDSLHSDISIS